MAMDDQSREGRFPKNLTAKQKGIAVLIVVILLVIVWQAMGLFSSSKQLQPIPAKANITTQATSTTPMSMNSPTAAMPPAQAATVTVPQQVQPKPITAPTADSEILKLQQETQKKYLTSLNELQMLKLEKDIAETNRAIASARLATVTAEKSISDLLTKPTLTALPAGAYASQLVSPVTGGTQVTGPPPQPAVVAIPQEIPYVVISVSMEFGKWHAVLGYEGKLYTVAMGDVLPIDGSTIVYIGKDGVILRKDGLRRKLSLTGAI